MPSNYIPKKRAADQQTLFGWVSSTVKVARKNVRPAVLPDCHTQYANWTAEKVKDIPEKNRTLGGAGATTDLKDFLTIQGHARGFKAHQNWPMGKKSWTWQEFDRIVTEDGDQRKTWEEIRQEACNAWTAKVSAEKAAEEQRKQQLEEARQNALNVALSQAQAAVAASQEAAADASQASPSSQPTDRMSFPSAPHQSPPPLETTDAYIREVVRLTRQEWLRSEEDERRALLAVLERKKSSRVQKGKREYQRSTGPPPNPTLHHHEVQKFVSMKLAPHIENTERVPDFDTQSVFPTAFELRLIPPSLADSPGLMRQLQRHPWLQARPEGIVCRCCFMIDTTGAANKVFARRPLPWNAVTDHLAVKSNQHIGGDARTVTGGNAGKRVHHKYWEEFMWELRTTTAVPRKLDFDGTVADLTERILNTQHLILLFNALRHVITTNRPHSLEVNRLLDFCGNFDAPTRSFLQKHHNLSSATIGNAALEILYAAVRMKTIAKIKRSAFVSLLTDEAQDIAKNKNYSVFFKILGETRVEEVFWDVRPLADSQTGRNIAMHVASMADPLQCWSVLMAVATDGCSAMAGRNEGMQSWVIRYLAPFCLWVWCMAHVFNLVCQEAASAFPVMQEGFKVVEKIFTLFHRGKGDNTGKHRDLDEVDKMVQASDNFFFYRSLQLVEVGETRWVSHHRASLTIVATLKTCLIAIQMLAQKEIPDAIALKSMLTDSALLSIFLQAALFPIVSQLSACLQRSDLCWADVVPLKEHYLNKLKEVRDCPETCVEYNNAHLKIADAKPDEWGGTVDYAFVRQFHRSFGIPYITKLIALVDDRLGNLDVVAAMGVYDPRSKHVKRLLHGVDIGPGSAHSVAQRLDHEQLSRICGLLDPMFEHYCSTKTKTQACPTDSDPTATTDVPVPAFFSESDKQGLLTELPAVIVEFARLGNLQTYTQYCTAFLRDEHLSLQYPQSARFIRLLLVMPLSTASVERSFSRVKLIRTYLRARMSDATLRKLLFIAFNVDDLDKDMLSRLVSEFVMGSVTENDTTSESDESAEESAVFLEGKRKLPFAKAELYFEAKNTILNWREAFSKDAGLFLVPSEVQDLKRRLRS